MTLYRIRQWYEFWDGNIYVSFSGGKDSTVLLHLVRSLYPEVPAVFVDTGLEYPEIKEFVKTVENVITIRPKISFKEVIKEYGYPVISKEVARCIHYAKQRSNWALNKLEGKDTRGNQNVYCQRMKKWKYLIDAPFKTSEKCCQIMKKEPFKHFEEETGLKSILGTMASEGFQRQTGYLKTGCNAFEIDKPRSTPLGFWKVQDILQYIYENQINIAKVYGDVILSKGKYRTTGVRRTGCMFCMFGINRDKFPNRFQRMAQTHPKVYDYCINKLGLKDVLEYINIPYQTYNNGKYIGELQKHRGKPAKRCGFSGH